MAQEVLDSHLRSLMPGHLTDVQSTDQHTVKPWFNGKLDYSPPVTDFAAARISADRRPARFFERARRGGLGLPAPPAFDQRLCLAGARLGDVDVGETVRQGYNMLHWTRAGMNWWIASDLNAEELESFANLCGPRLPTFAAAQ